MPSISPSEISIGTNVEIKRVTVSKDQNKTRVFLMSKLCCFEIFQTKIHHRSDGYSIISFIFPEREELIGCDNVEFRIQEENFDDVYVVKWISFYQYFAKKHLIECGLMDFDWNNAGSELREIFDKFNFSEQTKLVSSLINLKNKTALNALVKYCGLSPHYCE